MIGVNILQRELLAYQDSQNIGELGIFENKENGVLKDMPQIAMSNN